MKTGETGIRVIEAMTQRPVVVKPDISLVDSAKKMLKEDVGSLIIKDKGRAVGIITEQDFIKIIANKLDTEKTKLKDVMSKRLIGIDPNADIYEAMVKMNKENVRRLPVINKNNKLVGLLTVKDILVMQPTLIDLRLEHLGIRDNYDKIKEGECENCGSQGILHDNEGKLLCRACSY